MLSKNPTMSLFRKVFVKNMKADAKRPIDVDIEVNRHYPLLFTEALTASTNTVVGVVDDTTGLLQLNTPSQSTAQGMEYVINRAHESAKNSADRYYDKQSEYYKDQEQVHDELDDIFYSASVWARINKAIGQLRRPLPAYNTHIVYQNEHIDFTGVTTLTPAEQLSPKLVTHKSVFRTPDSYLEYPSSNAERLLQAFFDPDSLRALAWYFGAILNNYSAGEIQHMLMVTSYEGGCGKSTVISSLLNSLIPAGFSQNAGDFDRYFSLDNRFGTSGLRNCRVVFFDEAEWSGSRQQGKMIHRSFDGLDRSAFKTWFGGSGLTQEAKHEKANHEQFDALAIACSNFLPRIGASTGESHLGRRLLPCFVKSSPLADKLHELELKDVSELRQFIDHYAEEFIAYFTRVFYEPSYFDYYTQYAYDIADYDVLMIQDNQLAQEDEAFALATVQQTINKPVKERLETIHKFYDLTDFLHTLVNPDGQDVRYDTTSGVLYVNHAHPFFTDGASPTGKKVRKLMTAAFPNKVKKFGRWMLTILLDQPSYEWLRAGADLSTVTAETQAPTPVKKDRQEIPVPDYRRVQGVNSLSELRQLHSPTLQLEAFLPVYQQAVNEWEQVKPQLDQMDIDQASIIEANHREIVLKYQQLSRLAREESIKYGPPYRDLNLTKDGDLHV